MNAHVEVVDENSYAQLVDLFVDALALDKLGITSLACESKAPPLYPISGLLKWHSQSEIATVISQFLYYPLNP